MNTIAFLPILFLFGPALFNTCTADDDDINRRMEPLENKASADKNEASDEQTIKGGLGGSPPAVKPKKTLLKGSALFQEDKETACRRQCGNQCGEGETVCWHHCNNYCVANALATKGFSAAGARRGCQTECRNACGGACWKHCVNYCITDANQQSQIPFSH